MSEYEEVARAALAGEWPGLVRVAQLRSGSEDVDINDVVGVLVLAEIWEDDWRALYCG